MVFVVIHLTPGISAAQREKAMAGAPPFAECAAGYFELLSAAGWSVVQELDLTQKLEDVSRREFSAFEARKERLCDVLGESELSARLALRRAKLAGIQDGLIRRTLFVVRPECR